MTLLKYTLILLFHFSHSITPSYSLFSISFLSYILSNDVMSNQCTLYNYHLCLLYVYTTIYIIAFHATPLLHLITIIISFKFIFIMHYSTISLSQYILVLTFLSLYSICTQLLLIHTSHLLHSFTYLSCHQPSQFNI